MRYTDRVRRQEEPGPSISEEPEASLRPSEAEGRDLLWWLRVPDALVRRFVLSQVVGPPRSRQPWGTQGRGLGRGGPKGPSGGGPPSGGSPPSGGGPPSGGSPPPGPSGSREREG